MSGYIARCERCGGETERQPTPDAALAVLRRHAEGEHPRRRSERRRFHPLWMGKEARP